MVASTSVRLIPKAKIGRPRVTPLLFSTQVQSNNC